MFNLLTVKRVPAFVYVLCIKYEFNLFLNSHKFVFIRKMFMLYTHW